MTLWKDISLVRRLVAVVSMIAFGIVVRADDTMDHFVEVELSFAPKYEKHLSALEYIERARVTGIDEFCSKGVQSFKGQKYCELFYGGRDLWVQEGRPTIANIIPAIAREAITRLPFKSGIASARIVVEDLKVGRSGLWELEANFSKADVRVELLDPKGGVIDSFEGSKVYLLKNVAVSNENYLVDGATVHYSTNSVIAMALYDAFSKRFPQVEFRGVQVFGTVARPRAGFINRPKIKNRGDTP